jgi:hypothetical protein
LLAKGYHVAEPIRMTATRLLCTMNWARFAPTLDSPTNYMSRAARGRQLDQSLWQDIHAFLNDSIILADKMIEIDPHDPWVIQKRCSILSLKARLLLATGSASGRREADKLHALSLGDLERLAHPYGFAYPVHRDVLCGNTKSAIRRCQTAVEVLGETGLCPESEAAFAALLVQLSAENGDGGTEDGHIRRLADAAAHSSAIRYHCGHIFTADVVRKLLRRQSKNRSSLD